MPEETEIARALREAYAKRTAPNENTLRHWVVENFDELEHERLIHKYSFDDMAAAAASLGIKGDRGNSKPSGQMARRHFLDMVADKKRSEKTK
jgi:hypothetical protein